MNVSLWGASIQPITDGVSVLAFFLRPSSTPAESPASGYIPPTPFLVAVVCWLQVTLSHPVMTPGSVSSFAPIIILGDFNSQEDPSNPLAHHLLDLFTSTFLLGVICPPLTSSPLLPV